jgi:hypothetical protein
LFDFCSLIYAASRGWSYDLHGFYACHSRRSLLGLGVDVPAVTLIRMVEVLEGGLTTSENIKLFGFLMCGIKIKGYFAFGFRKFKFHYRSNIQSRRRPHHLKAALVVWLRI